MRNESKKSLVFLILVSLVATLFLFQNCSGVNFQSGANPLPLSNSAVGTGSGSSGNSGGASGSGSTGTSGGATGFPNNNLDVARIQPILAVRNMECMHCHSSVNGNLVSDFRSSGTAIDFVINGTAGADGQIGQGEYLQSNYGSDGARAFASTSFISGTVFVPRVNLTASTQAKVSAILAQGQQAMTSLGSQGFGTTNLGVPISNIPSASIFSAAMTPGNVATAANYLNDVLNYRTSDYVNLLASWPDFAPRTAVPTTPIREVSSVVIGAPSVAQLQALLTKNQKLIYIKTTSTSVDLSGFGLDPLNTFYENTAGSVMQCDGDIIVDGVVFLNNLQLNTNTGCRIYATGTIFVQGPAGSGLRQGIVFSGGANANLQLSSAKEISLGLGACQVGSASTAYGPSSITGVMGSSGSTFVGRMTHENVPYGQGGDAILYANTPNISDSYGDYQMIIGANGQSLLTDASPNCANWLDPARQVAFQHLLLNAPRIDSRYTGGFNGVIITDFLLWARGEFHYQYDAVFNQVPILQQIPASSFFQVNDCVNNGVDSAKSLDTNLKSCID